MSGTHHQLLYHLVFSTKNRRPILTSGVLQPMLEYLGGVVKGLDGVPLALGGWIDHVHLLVKLTTRHRLCDFMRDLKANSSRQHNEQHEWFQSMSWQDGYGAFSVGRSQQESVVRYIHNQEQHHSTISFQQEYLHLLQQSDAEYDERYLWD